MEFLYSYFEPYQRYLFSSTKWHTVVLTGDVCGTNELHHAWNFLKSKYHIFLSIANEVSVYCHRNTSVLFSLIVSW